MTSRSLTAGDWPRVSRRDLNATRTALRLISEMPHEWSCEAPPLGQASVAVVGIGPTDPELDHGAVELALVAGIAFGRLVLDRVFAALVVDVALQGRGARSTARRLGAAELGVLVGVLGRVFEVVGWSLRLGSPQKLRADDVTIILRFTVLAIGTGVAHLQLPDTASVARPPDAAERRARWSRVPIVVRVEIGATMLTASTVAAFSIGSIVLFERRRALQAGLAICEASLVIGAGTDHFAAPMRIATNGQGTLEGGFSREKSALKEETMDCSELFGSAPVEVVAELGRITLRADEAMGLGPGAVLDLGGRWRQVTLRVGGYAWAEGEIVDVEGQLGVRVLKVLQLR
jgi:type III secretion system YscQ/HrcQ family protein